MNSIIIFFVYLLLLVLECVFPQVCNETKSVFREVPETYRFTYIETYEEPCVIFCSVKTRRSVNVTTRMSQRFENVTVNVCCEGYVEDTNHKGYGLYCEPVCNPPCQNGYCRKPNQCACKTEYALDPLDPHICKPLCLEGCNIPDCISTKTPQCFSNSSSKTISKRQSLFCTKPCINAKCVGPEQCQCLPGYLQTSAFVCEPNSYSAAFSCEHGTLVDPYTCLCDKGWQWNCGSCQPICDKCEHGNCTSPGQCECHNGYVMEKSRCEPYCSNGCANGTCVSPEICSCDPGWYKTEKGDCKAHCDMSCEHGNCIAPNVCECCNGYQLYMNENISTCVPNRKDCEASNFDPKLCKCEAPYEARYFADNGRDCLNSSSRCINATCLFMDLAFDLMPPKLNYDYNRIESAETIAIQNAAPEMKDDNVSTVPTVERNEYTENSNTGMTSPKLDYDYDSDEEGDDQTSNVEVTHDIKDIETSTFLTIVRNETESPPELSPGNYEGTVQITDLKEPPNMTDYNNNILTMKKIENTTGINATQTLSESKYNEYDSQDEKTYKSIDLKDTPDIKDSGSTLYTTEKKEYSERTNSTKTDLNSKNGVKKEDTVVLPTYWIIGAVIAGIIMLLVLAIVVKQKCFKKHSLNSSGV